MNFLDLVPIMTLSEFRGVQGGQPGSLDVGEAATLAWQQRSLPHSLVWTAVQPLLQVPS